MKRLTKLCTLFSLALVSLGCLGSCDNGGEEVPANTYTNPTAFMDFADPYVFKADDGFWYAYATEGGVYRSSDMVLWESAYKVNTPTWGSAGAHIWAPCVVQFGDTYNYYYALSAWGDPNPSIGLMTADSPAGPFVDTGEATGKLFDSVSSGVNNSIDPDVFKDPVSGKTYIIWGSFNGIWAWELDSQTGTKTIGSPVEIISDRSYEAPNLLYKNNTYYLFMSAGSCCDGANSTYNVQVYTATSVLGPYTKSPIGDSAFSGSILHKTTSPVNGMDVYGPGHTVVVEDDAGDWWIYYHGYLSMRGTLSTRILFMDKILWEGNYPYVKDYVPSLTEQTGPYIAE